MFVVVGSFRILFTCYLLNESNTYSSVEAQRKEEIESTRIGYSEIMRD